MKLFFCVDDLSRELRSNQKIIKVLIEQNSHYQNHQRRCNEFQHNNQNQSTGYKNRQNKCT